MAHRWPDPLPCGQGLDGLIAQVADGVDGDVEHQRHCPHCQQALSTLHELWDAVDALARQQVQVRRRSTGPCCGACAASCCEGSAARVRRYPPATLTGAAGLQRHRARRRLINSHLLLTAGAVLAIGVVLALVARFVVRPILHRLLPESVQSERQRRSAGRGAFVFVLAVAIAAAVSVLAPELLDQIAQHRPQPQHQHRDQHVGQVRQDP